MNTKIPVPKHSILLSALLAVLFLISRDPACAQNTAFTYQGRVTDNGTNFNGAGKFKFALITGQSGTTNSTATAIAVLGTNQTISQINLTYAGSGYTNAPAVSISGGGGFGATATAVLSADGSLYAITVNFPGSNYTNAPTVTIAPPGNTNLITTYWSNDGTSMAGGDPATAVPVAVSNGLFTVVLGDTTVSNMTNLAASLFAQQANLKLEIWFNDGTHGSSLLLRFA